VKIRPKSVTFSGSVIPINQDSGGPYPALHWKDNSTNPPDDDNNDPGDHNIPVAYVRNTFMALTAEFAVEPADALNGASSVTVTGTGSAGGSTYVFTGTAAPGGIITINNVQANQPLPNSIQYLNPFTITWTITPQGGPALNCSTPIPSTSHRIYVLLGTPNTNAPFETLIHLSTVNTQGSTDAATAIPLIWNEFTDRDVRRKPVDGFNNPDGTQLTYYANWNCVNISTAALLLGSDGQCGSWAKFFIDAMGAQGVNHTNEYVLFAPDPGQVPGAQGFLVNTWSFAAGNGRSGNAAFPYLNIYDGSYVSGSQFSWVWAEVNDQTGVAGQGNANPNSLFGNHQVVKFGTPPIYYDPSYGVTFASLADIDSGAIAGYVKTDTLRFNESDFGVDLNHNGTTTDLQVLVSCILVAKNQTGNQLMEVPSEYPLP